MDGITDFVFREIISEIAKPDVLFTEFVSIDALTSLGKAKVEKKLLFSKKQHPIVAQIWGATPEKYEISSKYVAGLGFDGIDINMGCPAKSIIKKSSGASLINKENQVKEIIQAVRYGAPNLPLSIKTRLGSDENLTREWLTFLIQSDINALSIHGRNMRQKSKGTANWEEIKKAVEIRNRLNPDLIIIGNGDVKSYSEVLKKHNDYKVDGVMVGRGIFTNPWLFDKKNLDQKHSKSEYLALLQKHIELFHDTWGDTKYFESLKKYFKIYIKDFKGAVNLRAKLMLAKSYQQVCEILNQ
jgi:tRNA-dihydrouridine synthase